MTALAKFSPTITNMIRMDHAHVFATFHQYTQDKSHKTKQALAHSICLALEIHAQLEEEIFYPALRSALAGEPTLLKSVPEHNQLKRLIAQLRATTPEQAEFDSTLMELMRDTMHHVADEETNLLPQAEKILGTEKLRELGSEMTKLRLKLVVPHSGEIARDTIRGFSQSPLFWIAGLTVLAVAVHASQQAHD